MTLEQEVEFLKIWNPLMNGWMTEEKGRVLFKLVTYHKPSICVEIGTFAGMSAVTIAMGLKANKSGILFGIDPWKIEPCLEGTNAEANNNWWKTVQWDKIIEEYYGRIQKYGLLEYSAHFRRHDSDCLQFFAEDSIGLIHFDSNHSEEVAVATVHRWWSKLAPQCVIIVDDVDWAGQAKSIDVLRDYGCSLIENHDKYAIYLKP